MAHHDEVEMEFGSWEKLDFNLINQYINEAMIKP